MFGGAGFGAGANSGGFGASNGLAFGAGDAGSFTNPIRPCVALNLNFSKKPAGPEPNPSSFRFMPSQYFNKCPKNLLEDIAVKNYTSLRENLEETFPDVVIISSDGEEHKAHKCILMARSPVIKSYFTNPDTEESKTGIIKVPDLSSKAVEFLLHFIYACEPLPFDDEDKPGVYGLSLEECIYAADKYQVEDMILYFNKTLGTRCRRSNAYYFLRLANKFILLKEAQKEIKEKIMQDSEMVATVLDRV